MSAVVANDDRPPCETTLVRTRRFLDYLQSEGVFDHITVSRAAAAISQSTESAEDVLLELGLIEENVLLENLSRALVLEFVSQGDLDAAPLLDERIPVSFIKQTQLLPIGLSDATLTLATSRPLDDDYARGLAFSLDRRLELKLASAADISRQLSLLEADLRTTGGALVDNGGQASVLDTDAERLRDLASEAPVIRLFNRLLTEAVEARASDIHIEPLEDSIQVRFRLDGVLFAMEPLNKALQMGLTSRIKILSRLNIAERRLPQDGRIRLAIKGKQVDFRVSTSPTLHGESVVIRILDRRELDMSFAGLGFSTGLQSRLRAFAEVPNGLFLVSGPTGSGKTTTLYAFLATLNRPGSKVFTVEDPIEYHFKGVNQVLVRPDIGLDFKNVLRSILRQDPDIIMIGEIRDGETARIAVQAALTGHLVFSTVHTNSAAASVGRLRDLGVDDFLLAATLRGVLAQRLVRKLCTDCNGAGEKASCCSHCVGTGYRGRTVIHELLEINDTIRDAIIQGVPDSAIEAMAREGGMRTLADCVQERIESGLTSAAEARRVIGADCI